MLANAAYVLTAAEPLGDVATPIAASLVGPLIAVTSVALYLLLASEPATVAGRLAAIANVAAGALLTAMLLVQVAVDDIEAGLSPAVNDAFERRVRPRSVMGRVPRGRHDPLQLCDARRPEIRPPVRPAGIALAAALYMLNFASFPTPPNDAGLVDLGPLVGLWLGTE